jgi:hypothetical protein
MTPPIKKIKTAKSFQKIIHEKLIFIPILMPEHMPNWTKKVLDMASLFI